MSLTITINTPAPATLTVGVGVPGATGPAGAAGQGVPVGGTAGQFLTKINSTNYNTDWTTLPAYLQLAGGTMNVNAAIDLSDTATGTVSEVGGYGFAVSSASNINLKTNVLFDRVLVANATGATTIKPTGVEFPDLTLQTTAGLSPATAASTYQTLAGMSSYLTTSAAASTYQTLAGMSAYLTTATAATTYYPLTGNPSGFLTSAPVTSVAGRTGAITLANTDISGLGTLSVVNDAPSNGSQYARKNAAWDVVIPGDRYLTTSSTSNTVSNGNKTFTIGTGLSYTPTQNLTIAYDVTHHMHGEVLTYNSGTGVLTVDINNHTGSGTYASWVVNVGGVTPMASVAWGAITGTITSQIDLQNSLDAKLSLSGGTMTGAVTIIVPPSGPSYGSASYYYGGVSGSAYNYGTTSTWDLSGTGLAWNNGTVSGAFNSSGVTFPDATVQATAGISAGDVSANYYPNTNPSGFVTSGDVASYYYPLSNPSGFISDAGYGSLYARENGGWTAFTIPPAPGTTNAVWAYSMWYSANVTNIYDPGSYSYYNVLTF
jgi:hypothetical protein